MQAPLRCTPWRSESHAMNQHIHLFMAGVVSSSYLFPFCREAWCEVVVFVHTLKESKANFRTKPIARSCLKKTSNICGIQRFVLTAEELAITSTAETLKRP